MKAKFIQSAEDVSQLPHWGLPEVALVGRSNAGKSSFVNALTGQRLARVSAQPGKTRLLNFFDMESSWILVDLPGYGYAARSHSERDKWGQFIQKYLAQRESLKGLLLIMDCRRDWSDEEQWVKDFAEKQNLGWLLLANKADKLNQKETHQRKKYFSEQFEDQAMVFVSAEKKKGLAQVLKHIHEHWV